MPEGAENIALEPVPAVPEPTREPAEPAEPSALERAWVCLADVPEVLLEEPPPQVWLLSRWQDQRDHGVLPRGRTGLLTATGGVGKTYALIQLALAVASGGFWLDTFRAAEPGHVLLALAEEDLDEVRRRIWRAANAAELSTSERRAIADRLHILPLAGVSAALTSSPAPGVITATAVAEELRRLLEARGVDWSLVILDPLSRWAGGGVEADNEAATRFCQVVETLATVQGTPSVLVAHHSSKTSAKDGAADARGVTGIRDGFRWQASMDAVVTDDLRGVILRNRKSNYSLEFPDLALVRNQEPGTEGTLRLATDSEAEALGLKGGSTAVDYLARVLETIERCPGLTSASKVAERTKGRKSEILDAVKDLLQAGRIEKTPSGYVTTGR